MELFDTHAHLSRGWFGDDGGVDALVARAAEAGVSRITTIGAGGELAICEEAVAVAERHPQVYAAIGYHPHQAAAWTEEAMASLKRLAAHPKVRAIGETGLDYHYMYSPRETQLEVFRRFVALACEVELPLVIHSRDADEDTIAVLEEGGAERCGGVIHCYSSGWELARRALDLGFYISFSGMVTFKNAGVLREAATRVPADRLLVETDAPFLAPIPHRGKQNEPAWVTHTARVLAEARGESLEALAESTTANACRFYGISAGSP